MDIPLQVSFRNMDRSEAIEARDAPLAAELVREHTMRLRDYINRTWSFHGKVSAAALETEANGTASRTR